MSKTENNLAEAIESAFETVDGFGESVSLARTIHWVAEAIDEHSSSIKTRVNVFQRFGKRARKEAQ